PAPRGMRSLSDANAVVSLHDEAVAWSSLSTSRTAALPATSTVPVGFGYLLADASGSATSARIITAVPSGADTIVGETAITSAYGQLALIRGETGWIAKALFGARIDAIKDNNGNVVLQFASEASAVNYIEFTNSATG